MASPRGKQNRYDKFVHILTNGKHTVETFKSLPIFLHQLDENYTTSSNGSIAFRKDVYYPLADAFNLVGSTAPKGTISKEFLILAGNVINNLENITNKTQFDEANKLAGKPENKWMKRQSS